MNCLAVGTVELSEPGSHSLTVVLVAVWDLTTSASQAASQAMLGND